MTSTTLSEFVSTVYRLAAARKWDILKEYLALVREILTIPTLELSVGEPQDKETI